MKHVNFKFYGDPNKLGKEGNIEHVGYINNFKELPQSLQKPYSQMSIKELIDRAEYGSPQQARPYKKSWIVQQLIKRTDPEKQLKEYARIKGKELSEETIAEAEETEMPETIDEPEEVQVDEILEDSDVETEMETDFGDMLETLEASSAAEEEPAAEPPSLPEDELAAEEPAEDDGDDQLGAG